MNKSETEALNIAKAIARSLDIERNGLDTYANTKVWKPAKSKKYFPGDKVYPHGFGWGSKNNWKKPFYFISSVRAPGGGGYIVMRPNGATTMLTNIRHTIDTQSIKLAPKIYPQS